MATIQTFKGVVSLTNAQLEELVRLGQVSDGSTIITYSPQDTIYLTPQQKSVELIYDMSAGASLDWGYDSGVANGITVTGKDFSRFKGLYAYIRFAGETQRVYIDLTKTTYNSEFCAGMATLTKNIDNYDCSLVSVNIAKTSISVVLRYGVSSWTAPYSGDAYMYRLEGVL